MTSAPHSGSDDAGRSYDSGTIKDALRNGGLVGKKFVPLGAIVRAVLVAASALALYLGGLPHDAGPLTLAAVVIAVGLYVRAEGWYLLYVVAARRRYNIKTGSIGPGGRKEFKAVKGQRAKHAARLSTSTSQSTV